MVLELEGAALVKQQTLACADGCPRLPHPTDAICSFKRSAAQGTRLPAAEASSESTLRTLYGKKGFEDRRSILALEREDQEDP
jgi:hypothetical protein